MKTHSAPGRRGDRLGKEIDADRRGVWRRRGAIYEAPKRARLARCVVAQQDQLENMAGVH